MRKCFKSYPYNRYIILLNMHYRSKFNIHCILKEEENNFVSFHLSSLQFSWYLISSTHIGPNTRRKENMAALYEKTLYLILFICFSVPSASGEYFFFIPFPFRDRTKETSTAYVQRVCSQNNNSYANSGP